MSSYINQTPAAVLSSTINKYFTASVIVRDDNEVHIKSKDLDLEYRAKSIDKIGTTKRGIGPAYEDKVGRRGIRLIDLNDKKNLSKDLIITAKTKDGIIMALMHKKYNIHGVQFHPESIKTPIGLKILKNFVNY